MYKTGDELILHSENGMDYNIKIVDINEYREPTMKYACDVWDGNGVYAGDVMFFGKEFLDKCVRKVL